VRRPCRVVSCRCNLHYVFPFALHSHTVYDSHIQDRVPTVYRLCANRVVSCRAVPCRAVPCRAVSCRVTVIYITFSLLHYTVTLFMIHTYRTVLLPCTDCAQTVSCRVMPCRVTVIYITFSLLHYTVTLFLIHTYRTVLLPCTDCAQTVSCSVVSCRCNLHYVFPFILHSHTVYDSHIQDRAPTVHRLCANLVVPCRVIVIYITSSLLYYAVTLFMIHT